MQAIQQPLYIKLAEEDGDWRASGILHDFNNQLAIILSHCSIALTKLPADSNARSNLERAVRATKRAADLSGELQVAQTMVNDEIISISVNELVTDTVEALYPRLSAKATVEMGLANELPLAALRPALIQRALINLLMNAADAIIVDGGVISVLTESIVVPEEERQTYQPALPSGHYVAVQISDNGLGMDQTTLDQVFHPYFSGKATGSGLGLTMTLHIIQLHRGIIQVRSEPTQGTIFRVLLPVA